MIKPMLRRLFLLAAGIIGLSLIAFTASDTLFPRQEVNGAPMLVRYGRWLACASPIKFGERPQVLPDGDVIRDPWPIDEPLMWQWFRAGPPLSMPGQASVTAADPPEPKQDALRISQERFTKANADLKSENKSFESLLKDYASETHIKNAVDEKGRILPDVLAELRPNTSLPSWTPLAAEADKVFGLAEAAQKARSDLIAVLRTKPYPEAGVPLIPGIMSVAAPDLGWSTRLGRPVCCACVLAFLLTLGMSAAAALLALPIRAIENRRTGRVLGKFISWPVALGVAVAISILLSHELRVFPDSGLHVPDAASMTLWPSPSPGGGLERGLVLDALWHLCLPVACLAAAGAAIRLRSQRPATPLSPQSQAKLCGVIWPLFWISMLVECGFSLPGLGGLGLRAIALQERELATAAAVFIGASGLILHATVELARRRASK
jgi:ABC-type dipeptide/oligopeptide/nickel transport system permease component